MGGGKYAASSSNECQVSTERFCSIVSTSSAVPPQRWTEHRGHRDSFFDAIDRIGAPSYLPDDNDILRCRVRSTGIVEETFVIKHHKLRVFDVGGQRSERKKWIHAFEAVDQLVFVVAISEYDQSLYEDESVNRLSEAKMLFESLSSSRWFERSSFVLLYALTFLSPPRPIARVELSLTTLCQQIEQDRHLRAETQIEFVSSQAILPRL